MEKSKSTFDLILLRKDIIRANIFILVVKNSMVVFMPSAIVDIANGAKQHLQGAS
jgi:hypothetical protein